MSGCRCWFNCRLVLTELCVCANHFPLSLLELPHKTELICTLVGILNVGNRDIVALCLDRLNAHLTSGDLKWWQIVQVPRVFVELTNSKTFSAEALNAFAVESCQKLIKSGSEAAELVATALLLALPFYSGEPLANANEIMAHLEAFTANTERFTFISKSFDVKIEGFEAFDGNVLKALCEAVKGSVTVSALRTEPYKTFAGSLSDSKAHDDFKVTWSAETLESVQIAEFKPLELFSDVFEEPAGDVFSAIYYQFMLHMLIEAYELNHRRGVEVLFSCIPESSVSGVHIEKALCQVLFGKLLRSSSSATYYEVLLIDSCRLSRMFPPMMARSLMKLVAHMNEKEADLEVLERLASWFAHHLSHYDFKWNWSEWKEIAESSSAEPNCKRIFLRFLIYKLLLLSYQEKMQAVIPDFMLTMMPSMSSAGKVSKSFNDTLLEFMKKRPAVDEVREHVAREGISLQELFEVFLFLGSKTFSHLSSATDRYSSLFRNASIEDQRGFISCVSEFWADNLQNFNLVLEKLVQHQVLDSTVLLEWLFERVAQSKIEEFEVQVALKYFSSELFFTLIHCSSEKVQFARSLIDRLASFESPNLWVSWLVSGLAKKLFRSFFADKSAFLVAKTEALISMKENCANYPENMKEFLNGTYKYLTL